MNNNVSNNFNSMSGQQINPQYNSHPQKTRESNKFVGIIILLIVIGICIFAYIKFIKPTLTNNKTDSFLMYIEDVSTITGRGTVVTGKIEKGKIAIGNTVAIIGLDKEIITTTVDGIEIFRQQSDMAEQEMM